MRGDPHHAARGARRLLRCCPPAWRARYGEEFAQLLVDDSTERPRSARRTADVVFSGLLARLARAGILGDALEAEAQMRASVALLAGAVSVFLILGISLWSQLTIGWQWSAASSPATWAAMPLMSGAVGAFAVLAILAALPLVWTIVTACADAKDGRCCPCWARSLSAWRS